jgi:hypothetical protein
MHPSFEFEDPERLRVLKKLTACLQEITPENGYRHNLAPDPTKGKFAENGRVFRGRVFFGEQDPLPMICILETPLQPESYATAPDNPSRHGDWDLTIQGFVEDDFVNPTDPAQYLVADVIRRLAVEKLQNADFNLFGMGKTVTDIRVGVPVVRPPDELSAKAYFWLPVTLELAENLLKPYGEIKP